MVWSQKVPPSFSCQRFVAEGDSILSKGTVLDNMQLQLTGWLEPVTLSQASVPHKVVTCEPSAS